MVDYRKATGSAGTLIIRDNGSAVEFLVENASSATYFQSEYWSGKVNGVNVSGYYSINGVQTVRVGGPWSVATSQTVTFSIADTGTIGIGGPTSFSQAISRPLPNAPSNLSVARVSDTQHTLSWTRNSTYTSVVVQRSTNGGAWQQVGAPSGNAASFTDTTTTANNQYRYRVAGKAASGQSAWSGIATVYTTPSVPTGLAAARDGNDIVVSATSVSSIATGVDVRDGATVIASNVTLPYRHVAPNPATPHTYTARAVRGSLASAYSAASNTVQLLTRPNPPVNLAPNGATRASDGPVALTWVHNPVDSSPQTAFELRHRQAPAGAWTTISGGTASTASPTLPVGGREWQVRTKGSHPDWSDWSAVAVVDVIDRPGVAIVQPDGTWDASTLTVAWTYFQAQSRPQSGWEMRLLDDSLTVVETRSGAGATSSVLASTRLAEGDWTVEVRVAVGSVWSEWDTMLFSVAFIPPATPTITGEWDDEQGGVELTLAAGAGVPPTVRVLVERSLDGVTWEQVIEVDEAATLVDWQAWSWGDITYRATAFTVEGATAFTDIVVEVRSPALWLSGGAGFGVSARLPFDPKISITPSRNRALKKYAGRKDPVAVSGEAVGRKVSFSGNIADHEPESADVPRMTRIAQLEEPLFLFRDPDGNRIYGQIGDIQLSRGAAGWTDDGWDALWSYSVALTEAT